MLRADYDEQNCSIARTLEFVGERWSLLILREAFLGTRRFDEFQARLGIARNVLQSRLERLTDGGIMRRVAYQERPVRFEYRLTRKGVDLWPAIVALMKWGDQYAAPDGAAHAARTQGLWRRGRRSPSLHPLRSRARGLGRGPGAQPRGQRRQAARAGRRRGLGRATRARGGRPRCCGRLGRARTRRSNPLSTRVAGLGLHCRALPLRSLLVERVNLVAPIGRERNMHGSARRVSERDREVIRLLKAESNLVRTISPRSNLGKPERRQRTPIKLAASRKIAHADADMVDHDSSPWHSSGLYKRPRSRTESPSACPTSLPPRSLLLRFLG